MSLSKLSRFWNRSKSASSTRLFWDLAGIGLLLITIAALSVRLSQLLIDPTAPIESAAEGRNGLADFRDVVYYPSRAVREGVNPYDCRTAIREDGSLPYRLRYPILNAFPLYSPLVLVLFVPWSFGAFKLAALAWVVFHLLLLVVFSYFCWHAAGVRPTICQVCVFASCLLASQFGRANFIGGDTALPLAILSLAAVFFADRHPYLAAFALALTSFKPTFGLPLGILLLAAGYYRTVLVGWALGGSIAVIGLVVIFSQSGDLAEMPAILRHNQAVLESDPDAHALTSPVRIDSAGALQKLMPIQGNGASLIASLIVFTIAGCGLFYLRSWVAHPPAKLLQMAIVCVATVAALFHVTYDGLLIGAAIACVALAPANQVLNNIASRRFVAALLIFPMVNVLGTDTVVALKAKYLPWLAESGSAFASASWTFICMANGLCLLIALVAMARQAFAFDKLIETAPKQVLPSD